MSDINDACFYIDTVVKSVLVGANEMHTQMIFIFHFASMSMSHTTYIMHEIFVPFMYGRLAGGISVVALLTWFPQASPPLPPTKTLLPLQQQNPLFLVDVTVAAVISTDTVNWRKHCTGKQP